MKVRTRKRIRENEYDMWGQGLMGLRFRNTEGSVTVGHHAERLCHGVMCLGIRVCARGDY